MGHPGSLGQLESYDCAVGPFAHASDTAQKGEEEERADINLRKVTIERRKKGLHRCTNMDFYEMLTKPRMSVI